MLYILLYALLISKGFKHKDKEYIFITYPISIHIYIYKSFKFIHKMYPKSDKNNAKIIITNFTIQIADGGSIRVRSHLSWKEDRAKGGKVIRSSGYIYIKGGGAYWDSITATFARHAIPTPRNLAILRAATFPFLLEERTGALAPAVNCTPVIRSKAAVLSAPGREMDARSLFRSNRSRRRGFPSLMEISAAEFIRWFESCSNLFEILL